MIGRRALILGSAAIGLAATGAIFAARMVGSQARRAAAVAPDYLAGRAVVRAGWIISETEAVDLTADLAAPPEASAPDASTGDGAG